MKILRQDKLHLVSWHAIASITSSFIGVAVGLLIIGEGRIPSLDSYLLYGIIVVTPLVFVSVGLLRVGFNLMNRGLSPLLFKTIGVIAGGYAGLSYFGIYEANFSNESIDRHIRLVFELIGMFSGYCAATLFTIIISLGEKVRSNDNRD